MRNEEVNSFKELEYDDFKLKILHQLVEISKNHNILDELIDFSKDSVISEDLYEVLVLMRDKKITLILDNE